MSTQSHSNPQAGTRPSSSITWFARAAARLGAAAQMRRSSNFALAYDRNAHRIRKPEISLGHVRLAFFDARGPLWRRPPRGQGTLLREVPSAINEQPKLRSAVLRALTRDSHLFYSLSGHPLRMSYLGRHNASKAQPPGTCACAQIRPMSQLQFAYGQHAHRIRRRQISLGHVRVACKGHDFDFRPAGGGSCGSCCRRSDRRST